MIHSSSGCSAANLPTASTISSTESHGRTAWPGGLEPAVQRMGMTVAERRHQEAAVQIDLVGVLPPTPGLLAQRPHHAVDDQQRIGFPGRARSRSRRR